MSNATLTYAHEIQLPLSVKVTLALGLVVIIFVAAIGNAIMCVLVYQKKSMRSPINILLANMALTDFLLGTLCMPIDLVALFATSWLFKLTSLCEAHAFVTSTLMTANKIFLFVLSVDRYSIIVHHSTVLSPRFNKFIIVALYAYSIGLCIGPLLGWSSFKIVEGYQTHCSISGSSCAIVKFIGSIVLPYVVMTYTYFWIMLSVRKNKVKVGIEPSMMMVYGKGPSRNVNSRAVLRAVPCFSVDMRFKTRTFKTILILFGISVLCHVPSSVLELRWSLNEGLEMHGYPFATWSMYANSALNPLIYVCRIPKFRETCNVLSSCLPKCKTVFKENENSSRLYRIREQISTIS